MWRHADTWTLGELGVTILAVNIAYYAVLSYGVLTIHSALRNSSVAARTGASIGDFA